MFICIYIHIYVYLYIYIYIHSIYIIYISKSVEVQSFMWSLKGVVLSKSRVSH